MAKENKTKYAVMGVLSIKPSSGYDIKKLISESVGNFWDESYGQIYPILKDLVAKGLATKETEIRQGKPNRNHYTLTDRGYEVLQEWLKEPLDYMHSERNELLLKLFFSSEMPPKFRIKDIKSYKARLLETIKELEDVKKNISGDNREDKGSIYWSLTVDYGLMAYKALVDWCDNAINSLGGQP